MFFSILSAGISRVVFSRIDIFRRVESWELGTSLVRSACRIVQNECLLKTVPYDTLADLRRERSEEFGVGRISYNLVDEESRINLNTASEDVLSRLPGLGPDLARSIVHSSLRPFSVVEELLLVEGFNQRILDQCKDWITVYSNGKININTASVEVLKAFGIDEALATSIDDFRTGEDRIAGTKDDKFFEAIGEISTKLDSFASLSNALKTKAIDLQNGGLVTVASENFTLHARTFVVSRPAGTYAVVFNKDSIRRWQER